MKEHLKEQRVLNGQGYVRVIDTMGDDSAIVQAARVSYGKGTRTVREDEGLIRYLMRHRHTSPFEQCEIKFHVRVPMDTWRQWVRHRTANINEYSTRYSEAIEEMAFTSPNQWRMQAKDNKQGSDGTLGVSVWDAAWDGRRLSREETSLQARMREVYKHRLEAGVAREQARKDLPLSTLTEAYWKIDLHNLLHFLELRLSPHAQQEIREYAWAIARVVEDWVPYTWGAFRDYRLNAMTLTGRDSFVVQYASGVLRMEDSSEFWARLTSWGWVKPDHSLPRCREREECEGKLKILGITCPWNVS